MSVLQSEESVFATHEARELERLDSPSLLSAVGQLELLDQLREDASKFRITFLSHFIQHAWLERLSFNQILGAIKLGLGSLAVATRLAMTWGLVLRRSIGCYGFPPPVRCVDPIARLDSLSRCLSTSLFTHGP